MPYLKTKCPAASSSRPTTPEIEIVSPVDNKTPFWKAYKAGQQIAVQAHLKYLIDQLETCV